MMKTTFSQKHPYWAAILLSMLCTVLTAIGTAIPQILALGELHTYWFMAAAVAVSAGIGILIMTKSRFSVFEYGFNRNFRKSAREVLFYIPLFVIELMPVIVCGFSDDITPPLYIAIAFFTIAIGFNEEIYFRGLALRFIGIRGIRKAIVWSSVIFGLLHIANALNGKNLLYIVLQISFAFLVGFILAEIVSTTESIWVVIIWHTVHDFISMTTQDASDKTTFIIIAAQIIILLVYAIVLWKKIQAITPSRT